MLLGPLWFVLQPVFATLIYTVIFGKVAKIPTDGIPPVLFYMTGITAWNYFADCLNRTSSTFTANAGIFGKVYFPRMIVPLSNIISSLIKFGIQFLLLLVFIAFYYFKGENVHPNACMLLTPFLILMMAGMGLGIGIIVSSLTTKYRDLQNFMGFGVQLL
ncbi:MAG: ABC transporter permease, partial [Bacteroidetes bacterium]